MAKLTVGSSKGTPMPRILNPLFFLFGAAACVFGAAMCLIFAALLVIGAPFSFLTTVRMTEK